MEPWFDRLLFLVLAGGFAFWCIMLLLAAISNNKADWE